MEFIQATGEIVSMDRDTVQFSVVEDERSYARTQGKWKSVRLMKKQNKNPYKPLVPNSPLNAKRLSIIDKVNWERVVINHPDAPHDHNARLRFQCIHTGCILTLYNRSKPINLKTKKWELLVEMDKFHNRNGVYVKKGLLTDIEEDLHLWELAYG
jgi:hypothetical protein